MKRAVYIFIFLLAISTTSMAKKDKYNIRITIENATDSMLMMGYYRAEHTYVCDTAYRNKKNQFIFCNSKKGLDPGFYFFCNQKGKFVEFIIYNEEPFFTFETSEENWTTNMIVKGSKQNEILFNYHRLNSKIYEETMSKQYEMDSASFIAYLKEQRQVVKNIDNQFIVENPNHLLAKMMLIERGVETPFVNSTGDSLSQHERFEYFMAHYFDYLDLSDGAFFRTPKNIFYNHIVDYLDKYLKGAPPSVMIPYIDTMIERARPVDETFQWLVHFVTEKYLQSQIMGYDAIYVHLVQRYYATGEARLHSPSVVDEQVIRAEKWEKLLLGKVAPELIIPDTNGEFHSLHRQPHKYTLLVFWSPSCGHCKTMVPELYEKYVQYKDLYDIGAYAILSEPDENTRPLWRKFIHDHHLDWLNLDGGVANIDWHEVYDVVTTPQIYLLDKDKKILAKHLNARIFEEIIKFQESGE